MSKPKDDDARAQAEQDRRKAERDQRMKTGKAIKIPPPVSWRKEKSKWN